MTKQMSIAFVFDDSLDRPDGVQQQLIWLGRWLQDQGCRINYLCGETSLSDIDGMPIFSLSKNRKIKANKNILTIPRKADKDVIEWAIKSAKPDIVHVMLPYSPWLGARVLRQAQHRNIPIVGTFHTAPAGWLQTVGSHAYGLHIKPALTKFYKIISVSNVTALYVKKTFGVDSEVIHNCIVLDDYASAKANANKNNRSIVTLGRLVKRKGVDRLIKVFAQVNHQNEKYRLLIGSKGPMLKQLKALTKKLNQSDNVEFSGFIAEEEKAAFLANSALAVYPATAGEAFGIVLLEAMAAGTVVLAADNKAYSEVLSPSPTGQTLPIKDLTKSTQILKKYLEEESIRNKALDWQNEYVKQFDVETIGQKYINIYKQALVKLDKA